MVTTQRRNHDAQNVNPDFVCWRKTEKRQKGIGGKCGQWHLSELRKAKLLDHGYNGINHQVRLIEMDIMSAIFGGNMKRINLLVG